MKIKASESPNLILESSLQSYFFDKLNEVNKRSSRPVSNESIYYLSMVLDEFGESSKYFEEDQGKIREKVLGIKLLESSNLSASKKKRCLKEVGDTALFVCGYFYESLNSKMIDASYYEELGQIAYKRLDNFFPKVYEVPSFFETLSKRFSCLTSLLSVISKDVFENNLNEIPYLIVNENKVKTS